jgi:hypothetical protein
VVQKRAQESALRISARGIEAEFNAVPVTDARQVSFVIEEFRSKYEDNGLKLDSSSALPFSPGELNLRHHHGVAACRRDKEPHHAS